MFGHPGLAQTVQNALSLSQIGRVVAPRRPGGAGAGDREVRVERETGPDCGMRLVKSAKLRQGRGPRPPSGVMRRPLGGKRGGLLCSHLQISGRPGVTFGDSTPFSARHPKRWETRRDRRHGTLVRPPRASGG